MTHHIIGVIGLVLGLYFILAGVGGLITYFEKYHGEIKRKWNEQYRKHNDQAG